ncbi:hypothetical protein LCGC14_1406180 [marine sediment metagenome]|uniref:Peptidase C51 domain-containing protein n=1 Tax=marine sediment metagenome TaxID=412755 RepID=A0A0F9MB21_9ZZZZ
MSTSPTAFAPENKGLPIEPFIRQIKAQEIIKEINEPVIQTEELLEASKKVSDYTLCSCVAYARSISPFQPPIMPYARDMLVNQTEPKIGAWVKLREGNLGHLGIVIQITEDLVRIDEANFEPCKRQRRVLERDDPIIIGYYWE